MLLSKYVRKPIAGAGVLLVLLALVYLYVGSKNKFVTIIPVVRENLFEQLQTLNPVTHPINVDSNKQTLSKVVIDQTLKQELEAIDSLEPVDVINGVKEKQSVSQEKESELEVPVPDDKDEIGHIYDEDMAGHLNYDVWQWIVGFNVDDLRIHPTFPNAPDERKATDTLHIYFDEADPQDVLGKYGHKIYGYLIPPATGEYTFSIEMTQMTAACTAELWVSTDADPLNLHKVLVLEYNDLDRPNPRVPTNKHAESTVMSLDSRVHYFEFLEKAYEGYADVEVKWKVPLESGFRTIGSKHFAMAVKLGSQNHFVEGVLSDILKSPLPSNQLQQHHRIHFIGDTIYEITDLDVLPACEFKAEYVSVRRIKPYTGIYQVHQSKVYPKDETWFKNWAKPDKGNTLIDQATADKVLALYTKAFNANEHYQGEVKGLRYLEETINKEKGSRFLLELDIQLTEPRNELVHTSEYVYLPEGSDQLCHTSNFQWNKNVDVHLIVSVKNLGWWVKHLIHNVEEIYEHTHDDHFQLIIVDYESQDLDVEEELKKSSVKRWHVIHKSGPFSRSGGLQAGVDYITDPESIVMTIDMHLTMPPGFVEYTRRHVVKGKMGFTPFFFRLNKGYTEINYNGFWETLTYGLFGMYKSDWSHFGGFNTRKYTSKWGGEDWDLLDKAVAKGYEAFRIRYPGLVHYFHTKSGMWGNDSKKNKGKPG